MAETKDAGAASGAGTAEVPAGPDPEVALKCLQKLQCAPGQEMKQVPALRGLAALGGENVPKVDDGEKTTTMELADLEGLLSVAGGALLDRAGELKDQLQRRALCDALQYLSFRCFSALEVLRQVASGATEEKVPAGDALWGSILDAWGSVQSEGEDLEGEKLEGALADVTRWWLNFKAGPEPDAEASPALAHDAEGKRVMDAAMESMKQQAKWLSEGRFTIEAAAKDLEAAASAAQELQGLLSCAMSVPRMDLDPASGIDLPTDVRSSNSKAEASAPVSVYSTESSIVPSGSTVEANIEEWARKLKDGSSMSARSIAAVKKAEQARITRGLPRLAQTALHVALQHGCVGGHAGDPLGASSTAALQVQCEQCWPLSAFVKNATWDDVDKEMKEQMYLMILGACAVAEACNVSLHGVSLDSFVVNGVASSSIEDLEVALRGGKCHVLLSACSSIWWNTGEEDTESGAATEAGAKEGTDEGKPGESLITVLNEVLPAGSSKGSANPGPKAKPRGGQAARERKESERGVFVGHNVMEDIDLAASIACLEGHGRAIFMAAYATAFKALGCRANVLQEKAAEVAQQRAQNTAAFIQACSSGKLDKVQELLALEGDRAIDVHANDDEAFRLVCTNKHKAVADVLLKLDGDRAIPNGKAAYDEAFPPPAPAQ